MHTVWIIQGLQTVYSDSGQVIFNHYNAHLARNLVECDAVSWMTKGNSGVLIYELLAHCHIPSFPQRSILPLPTHYRNRSQTGRVDSSKRLIDLDETLIPKSITITKAVIVLCWAVIEDLLVLISPFIIISITMKTFSFHLNRKLNTLILRSSEVGVTKSNSSTSRR